MPLDRGRTPRGSPWSPPPQIPVVPFLPGAVAQGCRTWRLLLGIIPRSPRGSADPELGCGIGWGATGQIWGSPDLSPLSGQDKNRKLRPLYDIPYMFEAREFLRKKLIGKKVRREAGVRGQGMEPD